MATPCCSFELEAECDLPSVSGGPARAGTLTLPHGTVPTPAFMPVGTRGTVRGLTSDEIAGSGASLLLCNTYHLWVRPGHRLIEGLGGLHRFANWSGPILTDSGGYQVFSMRDRNKVTEEGVKIRSPEDGEWRMLTPEVALEVQQALGVDIAMAFDECLEQPATRERTIASTERTTRWLKRCIAAWTERDRTALFGIVQGGLFDDLRAAHAQELTELDLPGYAIGGLSVGEVKERMMAVTAHTAAHLPRHKVRYLMGVGHPIDIVEGVFRGVDLFDCVLPTRSGRHGQCYTSVGRVNLMNGRYADQDAPLDPACSCVACTTVSRAYLRHLFKAGEQLGKRLASVHNLTYYQGLVARLRTAIQASDLDGLEALRAEATTATNPVPF